ncbi:hypothetical protein [Acidiplasma sp.]|nr:hypothetical protein [Acidiplasma sp.]
MKDIGSLTIGKLELLPIIPARLESKIDRFKPPTSGSVNIGITRDLP